jgi:hypothetical protein
VRISVPVCRRVRRAGRATLLVALTGAALAGSLALHAEAARGVTHKAPTRLWYQVKATVVAQLLDDTHDRAYPSVLHVFVFWTVKTDGSVLLRRDQPGQYGYVLHGNVVGQFSAYTKAFRGASPCCLDPTPVCDTITIDRLPSKVDWSAQLPSFGLTPEGIRQWASEPASFGHDANVQPMIMQTSDRTGPDGCSPQHAEAEFPVPEDRYGFWPELAAPSWDLETRTALYDAQRLTHHGRFGAKSFWVQLKGSVVLHDRPTNTPDTTITEIASEGIRITYRRCPGTAPC